MRISELKKLIKQVRYAIIDANNSAQWIRVRELKEQKRKLQLKYNEQFRQNLLCERNKAVPGA